MFFVVCLLATTAVLSASIIIAGLRKDSHQSNKGSDKNLLLLLAITAICFHGAPAHAATNGQFLYAMHDDGTITVHDINNSHSLVKSIRVFWGTGADVRGAAAAISTARFYAFYNLNSQ